MSHVTIETNGPVMEELCTIEISDREASESLMLDNAEVEAALEDGHVSFFELLKENVGSNGYDILRYAFVNQTPTTINGQEVNLDDIGTAFDISPSAQI